MRAELTRYCNKFGSSAGLCWFSLGVPLSKAAELSGTRLAGRIVKLDPAAELDGFRAAALLGVATKTFSQWTTSGFAPAADRKVGAFSRWKLTSLADWAVAGCPGRNGKPQPTVLAKIGGIGPDATPTFAECRLGRKGARLAAAYGPLMPKN